MNRGGIEVGRAGRGLGSVAREVEAFGADPSETGNVGLTDIY